MKWTRRRLPHVYAEDSALFITWHLQGSLPRGRYPPPSGLNAGEAFVWMDRFLDTARSGPLYLRRPELADVVADALVRGARERRHYDLHAWVLMPNHVHLLATPLVGPSRMMRSLKSFTARECNRLLGRSGAFWQRESYDRLVRDGEELGRIQRYVEMNPVRAGLANRPEDWRWSSAFRETVGS